MEINDEKEKHEEMDKIEPPKKKEVDQLVEKLKIKCYRSKLFLFSYSISN